jgi:hypothetical protein
MGAASLAVDAVNRRSSLLNGTRLECTFYEFECGVNSAIPLLAGVLDRTPFGAVIGPGCMEECESSAILSGSLNIPLISYGCVASETLKNAQRYPTVPSELSCALRIAGVCPPWFPTAFSWSLCFGSQFVRLSSGYESWNAIIAFAAYHGWSNLVLLSSNSRMYSSATERLLTALTHDADMQKSNPLQLFYDSPWADEAGDSIRVDPFRIVVVVAPATDARAIGLSVGARGLMAAGWAWLWNDPGEDALRLTDEASPDAACGLCGWLYFEFEGALPDAYYGLVQNATPSSVAGAPSKYARSLYDAITLYGTVVARNPFDAANASRLIRDIKSTPFDGLAGPVVFNDSGYVNVPTRALNYVRAAGWKHVGSYTDDSKAFVPCPQQPILWPGGVSTVPLEVSSQRIMNSLWLFLGSFIAAVVAIVALVTFVRRKHDHLMFLLVTVFTELTELVSSRCERPGPRRRSARRAGAGGPLDALERRAGRRCCFLAGGLSLLGVGRPSRRCAPPSLLCPALAALMVHKRAAGCRDVRRCRVAARL